MGNFEVGLETSTLSMFIEKAYVLDAKNADLRKSLPSGVYSLAGRLGE